MDKYLEANRALWNEWADINYRSDFYRVADFKAGLNKLRTYEMAEVGPVDGKDLLHLQCHFGLDTLCWARLGARVTGADFSTAALSQARALAEDVGLDARFVESDIYELPQHLGGSFDVVYTSRGVLGWLPDLDKWGKVAAHFVKPGGFLYITEIHPVAQVFDDDEGVRELRLRYPYFTQPEPISTPTKGSYADRSARVAQEVEYGWSHGLGEIVTALTTAGLRIDFLHEFPFAEWPIAFLQPAADGTHRLPSEHDGKLPLFFSLKASKPASAGA
ncbi:MAG TPA: class I SAM-dependent methyltransferase [Candidatus Polarisedimenticolia bacterium]|nr:class I SAM-dependent methyltransferase [Candidatus Polarisedimenticolia bacterium]